MKWWDDTSFYVYPDIKSHTEATMSLGNGSIYSTYTRQNINMKISTEADIMVVGDVMPMVLWRKYFLEY